MSIDQNDNGTIDLLDRNGEYGDTGPNTRITVEGFGTGTVAELEHHLKHLKDEREAGWDRVRALENKLDPLAMLADAIAALPVFVEMAADLEDLNNRLASIEMARDETPTLEDVVQEIEHSGSIEDAVATVLADRSEHPADDIDGLAAAVADMLSVEVEIDDITVEASASVSVS
ncbi:MAG: hypothetical protein ACPHEP_02605 [Acidimicrobiales bacterium]